MWIQRDVETLVLRMAGQFPAVLVTGTRQAGKTALLRRLFPQASYLTLDLPNHAEAARTAPEALLNRYPEPLIIDEIQYAPELLRYLKVRIDQNRSPGRFLLTGSQVFELMRGVSESLAGRCGVVDLLTLSYREVKRARESFSETRYMFLGGYPELHVGADPELWFPSYIATYLERDVRNLLQVTDLQDFYRFVRTCALRTAQVLNYSDIARDVGISTNTARKWLNLLQTSGVVFLLEPYFGSHVKRLIKSPKLLFLDTGLASFCVGFRNEEELSRSPYAGPFWETHVIGQVRRTLASRGVRIPLCYWRSIQGPEVDLVIEPRNGSLVAVEVKMKERPTADDARGLRALSEAEAGRNVERFLVARTDVVYRFADGTWVTSPEDFLRMLEERV